MAATDVAGAFLGTTHTAETADGVTFSSSFTGNGYCVINEGGAGTLTMVLDESRAFRTCRANLRAGPHTATVTYTGASFVSDGFAITP